jgi:4a-hydroxytetrahydrobiopterin dehydratase
MTRIAHPVAAPVTVLPLGTPEMPPAATGGVARVTADEASARLQALPSGWHIDGDVLVNDLAPRSFTRAIALAVEIAARAEAADHHPDIALGFGRLEVRLTTHDAGGLSGRDFDLAASIEAAVAAASPANDPPSPMPTTPPSVRIVAPLTSVDRAALSTTLPAWHIEHDALVRVMSMPFLPAAALLNDVAAVAQQHDHHPDIELNGGQLVLRTTTHDAGGLSQRDVALAHALDEVLVVIVR